MKVIKPNKLSVLTRCFEHERRFRFGVSVLMFVPMAAEPALLSEVALWTFAAERMPEAVLEPGMPKARGEFLVHGSCFAPGGVPHPRVPVVARVGECERAMMVTGDRYWTPGGKASEPQPFTRMPLDWSRTYGGPRYKRNPLGRGHGESEYMGQRVQMLPNIEDPESLVLAPRDRVEPVGLGPMDIAWPQRRELAGTYDDRWLREHFPGMAPDIDWRIFNLAQPAQQVEDCWEGGETYRFDNMHPQRPVLEGELPRLVARAFVGRRVGGETEGDVALQPVDLSLRTLWFFPDAERAVLVYQGVTGVEQDDGADVEYLVIAAEHADRPRAPEHYAAVVESRLDPDQSPLVALREHELLPEGLAEVVEEHAAEQALHQIERKLEHNLHRRAQREYEQAAQDLRDRGLDPVTYGLQPPAPPPEQPKLDEIPAMVEQLRAEALEEQERQEVEMERSREKLAAELEALGYSAEEREKLVSLHEQGPTGPPTFTARSQRESVQALLEQARQGGGPTDQLEQFLNDPALHQRWEQAEAQLRENYRKTAHLQDPAPPMTSERSEEARLFVRRAVERSESFFHHDLTGADLSGMDLQGADLRDALLESACLDGADLRRADLRGAVLAHASLRKVRLDGANLQGANLGRSALQEASLVEADLGEAELMEAELRGATLRGSSLEGASLVRASLVEADLSEVRTDKLILIEVKTTGLRLVGAQLREAVFVELDLRGSDCTRARLDGATFVGCDLRDVSLAGAELGGARFVKECRLDGVSLVGARLGECNLRGSAMEGCDLSGAQLDGADLSECTLVRAKLYRAVARGTRFEKADLSDASLVAANLMHASFLKAIIRGADLRGSNLHGADMARVRTDERVRLDEAILTRVRIHPRHAEAGA